MSASKPRESRRLARLDELRALPSRQGVFEAGDRARSEQRAQAVGVQRCDRDLLEPRRASVSHLVRRSGRAAPEGQIEGRPRSPSRARPLHATTRTSRCERLPSRCAAPTERRQRRRRLVLSPACSGGPAQPLSADLGGRLFGRPNQIGDLRPLRLAVLGQLDAHLAYGWISVVEVIDLLRLLRPETLSLRGRRRDRCPPLSQSGGTTICAGGQGLLATQPHRPAAR